MWCVLYSTRLSQASGLAASAVYPTTFHLITSCIFLYSPLDVVCMIEYKIKSHGKLCTALLTRLKQVKCFNTYFLHYL